MELGITETRKHSEIQIYWMPGSSNPVNLFTREDNDVQHFESLRDQIVMACESFGISFYSDHSTAHQKGVLKHDSTD